MVTPTQTNYLLTTTTAFLLSPPCLFVQQTTTIYLIRVNKPISIPEGLIIGCILRFTAGWGYNWQGGGIISGSLRYVIGLDLRFEITVNGK